jgi:hypothetical protein
MIFKKTWIKCRCLFIMVHDEVVCHMGVAVPEECSVRRQYEALHKSKFGV